MFEISLIPHRPPIYPPHPLHCVAPQSSHRTLSLPVFSFVAPDSSWDTRRLHSREIICLVGLLRHRILMLRLISSSVRARPLTPLRLVHERFHQTKDSFYYATCNVADPLKRGYDNFCPRQLHGDIDLHGVTISYISRAVCKPIVMYRTRGEGRRMDDALGHLHKLETY